MLTLGRGDAGAAHAPALWSAGHWRAAVLAAQAEQAVLPSGQAEARQGQRVDLLLGQVRRQLLINGNTRGELAARSTGARARTTAHVGVARAYNAVVDVVLGVDVDRTGGLDNGGIALIAGGQLGDLAELGHLDFGGADEVGHCRFQAGEVVGVITAAGKPVLIGEGAGGIKPAAGAVLPFAAVHPHRFGIVGLYAGVGQVVQRSGEVAAGGDGAALVKQLAAVDVQITASGDAGRRTGGGHFQFFTLGDIPGMSFLAATAVIKEKGTPINVLYGSPEEEDVLSSLLTPIAQRRVGNRPGRIESRAIKRRPQAYPLLTKSSRSARADVRKKGHAKQVK